MFQPLFASASLRTLWKHSLEMAESAALVAQASGRVSVAESFLAGLVHDIGRLAIEKLPRADSIVYARLLERGCDPVFAELVLCGYDHGDAGAEILRIWSFPIHLVDAVQHHHWPERDESTLAAVLYLGEQLCGAAEDAPSALRVCASEDRLGVSLADLNAAEPGLLSFLVA